MRQVTQKMIKTSGFRIKCGMTTFFVIPAQAGIWKGIFK